MRQRETIGVLVRALEAPTDAEVTELADLFDQYRAQYGQAIRAGRSEAWLRHNLGTGRLTAFVAEVEGEMVGFALTMDVPASLRLGHHWQVRDLFVAPGRRRLGVGRTLLDRVRNAAIAAGALRLSVQTETDNAGALQLYRERGFTVVDGYVSLSLPLVPDDAG